MLRCRVLFPLLEDVVDSFGWRISLVQISIVVSLAKLVSERGECAHNLLLCRVIGSEIAADISQVKA